MQRSWLVPLWKPANRIAARASTGAVAGVSRQRHKTDKTRVVAILFLCIVRDGRRAVPELESCPNLALINFFIPRIFSVYFTAQS